MSTKQIDTPRTDAAEYEHHETQAGARMRKCKDGGWVKSDFARELERENAALRADKERVDWLELDLSWPIYNDGEWHNQHGAFPTMRDAIDAARKATP
jgi:hypothetical protein